MEIMFWVWLGVIALTLIIELCTMELVSIWFTLGAIIPFILSAIGGIYIELQIAIFVVVSALLIIFVRKYAKRLLLKNMNEKTNLDSIVGKHFRVVEETTFEKNGTVKINDVVWSIMGENQETIEKGSIIEVLRVEGNKLIVKKVEEIENSKKEKKDNLQETDNKLNNENVESLQVSNKKEDDEVNDENKQTDGKGDEGGVK